MRSAINWFKIQLYKYPAALNVIAMLFYAVYKLFIALLLQTFFYRRIVVINCVMQYS